MKYRKGQLIRAVQSGLLGRILKILEDSEGRQIDLTYYYPQRDRRELRTFPTTFMDEYWKDATGDEYDNAKSK